MKAKITALALPLFLAALAGCQSTDALDLNTRAPLGQASVTGQTPLFEADPKGVTAQMTDAEKANIRNDLQASATAGAQQAAADNDGIYRAGVSAFQRDANALTQERLNRIQNPPAQKPVSE